MKIGYNYLRAGDDAIAAALLKTSDGLSADRLMFGFDPKRGNTIQYLPLSAFNAEKLRADTRSWIYTEIFLPFAIAASGIDIFFSPSADLPVRQPCKTAVTVKDLYPLMFDDEKPKGMENSIKYRLLLSAIKKANRVVTFSRSSKSVISKMLGIPNKKIAVAPYPVGKEYVPVYSESSISYEKARRGLSGPYFFCRAGRSSRHNLKELLTLFNSFLHARNDALLAIHCADEKTRSEIKKSDTSGRLVFLEGLSAEEQCLVLNGSCAYLSASLHESSCEEELKALACGIPIIAYETQAFSEILGHSAALVSRGDRTSFIRAMKDAKDHPNMRLQMRALGIQHSKMFTPDRFLAAVSEILVSILEERYAPDEK